MKFPPFFRLCLPLCFPAIALSENAVTTDGTLVTQNQGLSDYNIFQWLLPQRLKSKEDVFEKVGVQSAQDIDPYDVIPRMFLPERHDLVQIESNLKANSQQEENNLFASKYQTVQELVENLIGDVEYIRTFNVDKPFNYNYEDIEESEKKSIKLLTEELMTGLYVEIYRLFNEFSKIYKLLQRMDQKDYIAIYDHIYGPENEELVAVEGVNKDEWDFRTFKWEGIEPQYGMKSQAYIPFIDSNDDNYSSNSDSSEEVEVGAQSLLFKFLLIPAKTIILIEKFFWKLIAIKKLIELAETKVCLTIIALIQKTGSMISLIKKEIIFEVKVILWTIKSGALFRKVLSVIFLIIKKLKVLSWILKDLLYRYRWKLIFLLKKVERKSFLVAIYFQELIYAKLGIKTAEEKRIINFVSYDDDYYDWDDYDYYKEFSHYVYSKPGTYRTNDPDFQQIIDDLHDDEEDDKDEFSKGNGIQFDMKEKFGFDTIHLNLKNMEEIKRLQNTKYRADKYNNY